MISNVRIIPDLPYVELVAAVQSKVIDFFFDPHYEGQWSYLEEGQTMRTLVDRQYVATTCGVPVEYLQGVEDYQTQRVLVNELSPGERDRYSDIVRGVFSRMAPEIAEAK